MGNLRATLIRACHEYAGSPEHVITPPYCERFVDAMLEAEARAGLDVEMLATALRWAEQENTDAMGIKGPADSGPPSDWYRGYARVTAAKYEALARQEADRE